MDTSVTSAIRRYDFNGSAWINTYSFAVGARGLTVDWSGANPILYATTTESNNNSLISISDTGSASTPTILASAGTNYAFRGVDFAPGAVPEPCTCVLLIAAGIPLFLGRRSRAR